MATPGFGSPISLPPPVLRTGSRARRGLVGSGWKRRRCVCPGRRGCGGSRARGQRRAGLGLEEEGARVGARRPASLSILGVRKAGLGGLLHFGGPQSRRRPHLRRPAFPSPTGRFCSISRLWRLAEDSGRRSGFIKWDPAVLAHHLLGFVVPPVLGGSACPVWRGGSGASAALPGECWEEDVRVAGAGWARRCEAGGR